jgi:hypothetical protein
VIQARAVFSFSLSLLRICDIPFGRFAFFSGALFVAFHPAAAQLPAAVGVYQFAAAEFQDSSSNATSDAGLAATGRRRKSPVVAFVLNTLPPGFGIGNFYARDAKQGRVHLALAGGSFLLLATGVGAYPGIVLGGGNYIWSLITGPESANRHNRSIASESGADGDFQATRRDTGGRHQVVVARIVF